MIMDGMNFRAVFGMRARAVLLACVALAAAAAVAAERGGGIKVGGSAAGSSAREAARGGGVRIGGTRARTSPAPPPLPRMPSVITAALVVPHKAFGARDYTKAEKAALSKLPRKLKLFSHVRLNITLSMQGFTPSPMCEFLVFQILVT